MTPTNKRIGCWSYVGHHHFTSFIDFTGETGESGEMVIAADWPSRRPSVAAQEMSGWWSLTSTTKADSAQPAVLGGRSAAPWVEKSSAVEKKHWWCRQVLYTEYHGCLQKVRSRKHIRGLPKVPRLFRVSFPHVSTPLLTNTCAPRGTIIDQVVGSGRFLGLHVSP